MMRKVPTYAILEKEAPERVREADEQIGTCFAGGLASCFAPAHPETPFIP